MSRPHPRPDRPNVRVRAITCAERVNLSETASHTPTPATTLFPYPPCTRMSPSCARRTRVTHASALPCSGTSCEALASRDKWRLPCCEWALPEWRFAAGGYTKHHSESFRASTRCQVLSQSQLRRESHLFALFVRSNAEYPALLHISNPSFRAQVFRGTDGTLLHPGMAQSSGLWACVPHMRLPDIRKYVV